MAGLYKRTVVPNFATPAMQAQASQGAGGAIPRGGVVAPRQEQPRDNSEQIKQIGGLLGSLAKERQMSEELAPTMDAVKQTVDGINALPDTRAGMPAVSAPLGSTNGEWGGVQMSALGPGVPASPGEWAGAANGYVPNFGAGLALPGMNPAQQGAMTPFGGGIPGATAATTGMAGNNLQLPAGLLQMLPLFGGGMGGAGF